MDANGVLGACFDATNNALRITGFGDTMFISPNQFQAGAAGTPALVVTSDVESLEYDAAATEFALASFVVPAWWGTMGIDLFWGKRAGTTGDVRWRVAIKDLAANDLATEAFAVDTSANVAVPGTAAAVARRDNHATMTATNDRLYSMRVERTGADVGDTFASDAALFGVRIRRTG